MIGYARVFVAHILKHWPGISQRLTTLVAAAGAAQLECEIPSSLLDRIPGSVLKSLRWHPPAFPQRVWRRMGSHPKRQRLSSNRCGSPG
jgi:hypothetical protein